MKIKLMVLLFMLLASSTVLALENKSGVGLNYPGLSFKYFVAEKASIEPKMQFGDNIFAGGLRGNYYFSDLIYSGLELAYITFEGEVSEGSGFASSLYGGIEISATDKISLQLDIGPLFLHMSDKNYDVTGGYFQILGNIGLNYYFYTGAEK